MKKVLKKEKLLFKGDSFYFMPKVPRSRYLNVKVLWNDLKLLPEI